MPSDAVACPGCGLGRAPDGWPQDPHVGRLIQGKYQVVERLGEGGFGVVLRARQIHGETDLGDVVLKLLHPGLVESPSARRRFLSEARLARALTSPHVVKIYDVGFDERGTPFLAMEFVDGLPLAAAGRLPPARVLQIGVQIARALEECHRKGIIHRDLKPDNVLLLAGDHGDFVKVIDFGIAREQDAAASETLVGTPRYMAPEQIQQRGLDGGADIFALGVMLFECFSGEAPVAAATPFEQMRRNVEAPAARLRDRCPGLPEALDGLLDRMMAKDRAARPQSMADVARRLEAIGTAAGWRGREEVRAATRDLGAPGASAVSKGARGPAVLRLRPWTIAGMFLVLGLAVGGALWLRRSPRVSPGRSAVAVPALAPARPDARAGTSAGHAPAAGAAPDRGVLAAARRDSGRPRSDGPRASPKRRRPGAAQPPRGSEPEDFPPERGGL